MIEVKEAAKKFGIKNTYNINRWVGKLEEINHIRLFSENNQLYISENDYKKLKRNSENNLPYNLEIPDGYLTRNEAVKKYGITYHALRQQEKNGIIKIVKIDGISLLEETSLEKLKKNREEINLIEKNNEWIKVSNLHKISKKYDKILITLNRNEFNEQVKTISYGKKIERFITKKLYQEIIDGKYDIVNYNTKVENILPDDIKDIIDDLIMNVGVNSTIQKGKMKNLVLIDDISKATKIDVEDLLYSIKKIDIKLSKDNGKEYIYEYDVESLMYGYGYYSVKRLGKVTNIIWSTLKRNFLTANVFGMLEYFEINNTLYLTLESMEQTLKEYSKKYISTLNLDRIKEERIKLFPDHLPETLELAIKFINSKKNIYIKEYGEDTINFVRLINAIDTFIFHLEEEIFNCNSDYILNIISDKEKMKTGYIPNVCQFLNFVKKNLKARCRYNKLFGKTVIEQFQIDNGGKIEDKIYDKQTWAKYYLILKDIDKHIEESIFNFRYSQCWLYCILNLSVTWRKKNILLSLPRINLEEVGIYNLEWFNEKHVFTLDMANSVLEQIKFSLDGVIAYKNKRNLHFNIPLSLKVPTAIAFIICELHSRNNNENLLLYELNRSDIRSSDYRKLFLVEELLDFQNLKCTRSIMSYGYSYAINTIGMVPAAYNIYSNSRSHTNSEHRINNVTGDHYLVLDSLEGGAKEYMYHIVERGAFGFMYYKLFQCIIEQEKFDSITQKEMTQLTQYCQEIINPMSLENVAGCFIEDRSINSINMFEMLWYNSLNKNLNSNVNQHKKQFLDNMIEIYELKAKELFGDNNELSKYIKDKYKNSNNSINELCINEIDMKVVLARIANGKNCCFSEYTNCIFDRLERKEKCPHKYGEKGGASCLGCKYNLMTIYALYEVSDRLKILLNKIQSKIHLSKEELIKNSYMIKNYLSIIIEAQVHFREKEFINNIINLKDIKKQIIHLKNINKIINF